MNALQEPKYEIRDGKLVNRQSGEAIPDDEPIFILRARDRRAGGAIAQYCSYIPNGDHHTAVSIRLTQFNNWAKEHPERMKEPDTILTNDWQKCVQAPKADTTEVKTDLSETDLDPTPE